MYITVLGIFKFHPRSRLLYLSQSHYHLNPDFITTASGISSLAMSLADALQSGQCFAVIDCMASRMSYFIPVKWKARHIDRLLWVGLAQFKQLIF